MTTGRINQVTIVSYPRPPEEHGSSLPRPITGPFTTGRFVTRKISSFRDARVDRRPAPRGQPPSLHERHTVSPGPTNFRGQAGLPRKGETPLPQDEDCQQTGCTRWAGLQVQADLQVATFAFRFNPSASNPHPSHPQDARHRKDGSRLTKGPPQKRGYRPGHLPVSSQQTSSTPQAGQTHQSLDPG